MKSIDIITTANSNLTKNKVRTLLTIIAIFIGAFTLSLTNGVGTGFGEYFDKQIANVGFDNSLIITRKNESVFSGNIQEYQGAKKGNFGLTVMQPADLEKIKQVKGLSKVERTYNVEPEYITAGNKKFELRISAYLEGLQQELSAGRLLTTQDTSGIILTKPYVEVLGFTSPQDAIGKKVTISVKDPQQRMKDFELAIVGVRANALIEGGSLQASRQIITQMDDYQSGGVPSLKDEFLFATASFDNNLSTEQIDAIKSDLGSKGYEGQTIQDQIGSAAKFIQIFQIALNSFGAIALVAATFGIVNTLLMAVNERTREIGLAKALGMSRRTVFSLFSLEAVLIGFWGSILGIFAAIGAGALFNNVATKSFLKDFEGLHMSFPLINNLAIIGLIMLIAFLAGTLPSRRASKLDPIEALRYE